MKIIWVLYTFVAFAPDGNINGLQKGLQPFESKIECQIELQKNLDRFKINYPKASHIQGVCFPDGGMTRLTFRYD